MKQTDNKFERTIQLTEGRTAYNKTYPKLTVQSLKKVLCSEIFMGKLKRLRGQKKEQLKDNF